MVQRIVTGAVLVAIVVVALLCGRIGELILAMAAIGLALYEELNALHTAGHKVPRWPCWVAYVLGMPLVALASPALLFPLLVTMLLVSAARIIFSDKPDLQELLLAEMPLLTIVTPGMCVLAVITRTPGSMEIFYLCLVLAIAILGDTFAYFIGKRFGEKKFCPAVSPNKTVAGAWGGLLGSMVSAMLVWGVYRLIAGAVADLPPFWLMLPLGLLGGAAGQLGDLFASLVKRHCGIKDFSNIFPGHGGMMDRMDSILFVAVAVYCFQMMLTIG